MFRFLNELYFSNKKISSIRMRSSSIKFHSLLMSGVITLLNAVAAVILVESLLMLVVKA